MTIRIEAWQKYGVKSDKCEETFEFCCWDSLFKWLEGYSRLHKCAECIKKKQVVTNG